MPEDFFEKVRQRAQELRATGLEHTHAFGRAHMESLLHQWPTAWGDDFQVLLYGDFKPPESDLDFPTLGIRVLAEPLKNTVISTAKTVVAARVTISERSVEQIIDASRRVNVLLGAWTLVTWGNCPIGWWSHVSHGSGGGVLEDLDHEDLERAVNGVAELPESARRKVDAALFWIREPGRTIREHHRPNVLRRFSAYWNAFECLVDAVCILRPRPRLSKTEKQQRIDQYVAERGGKLTAADIDNCYRTIVDQGLKAKASHALALCFGEDSARYVDECFTRQPRNERLYSIRNAINHGDVDAENPDEVLRIDARLARLWMIVFGMFGRLIPFPCPLDRPLSQ